MYLLNGGGLLLQQSDARYLTPSVWTYCDTIAPVKRAEGDWRYWQIGEHPRSSGEVDVTWYKIACYGRVSAVILATR